MASFLTIEGVSFFASVAFVVVVVDVSSPWARSSDAGDGSGDSVSLLMVESLRCNIAGAVQPFRLGVLVDGWMQQTRDMPEGRFCFLCRLTFIKNKGSNSSCGLKSCMRKKEAFFSKRGKFYPFGLNFRFKFTELNRAYISNLNEIFEFEIRNC